LPGKEEQVRYSSRDPAEHRARGLRIEAELAQNRQTWTEPCALFSSEHILPWLKQPDEVQSLDTIFRRHFSEVRYIVYLRNPEDSLVSEYSENLKRGSTYRMEDFLPKRLASVDQYSLVSLWTDAVGRGALDVRLLDPGFLQDGDLITDYCAACGIDPAPLTRPPRVNESLSAPAAECLRGLNKRVPQILPDGSANPLHKGFVFNLMAMSRDAPRLALSAAHRSQVAMVTRDSAERLRATFFPHRPTLYTPSAPRPEPDPAQTQEAALDLAAQIIVRLRMGEMAILNEAERARARRRVPKPAGAGQALKPERKKPGAATAGPTGSQEIAPPGA
jgi:hypothetical protein